MAKDSRKETNTKEKSRRSPALALLLVLLIAAAFFVMSDVPFIKSARDSLLLKLGYEAVEPGPEEPENGSGGTDNNGDDPGTNDDGGANFD